MKRLIKKVTFYKENKKITHAELHINKNCVLFFVKKYRDKCESACLFYSQQSKQKLVLFLPYCVRC